MYFDQYCTFPKELHSYKELYTKVNLQVLDPTVLLRMLFNYPNLKINLEPSLKWTFKCYQYRRTPVLDQLYFS